MKPYSRFTKQSDGRSWFEPPRAAYSTQAPPQAPIPGAAPSKLPDGGRVAAPAAPEAKPFRSAVNTGLQESGPAVGTALPFKAPEYWKREGVDPQLAAEGQKLEQEYAARFPYGDYTYSTKGWNPLNPNVDASALDLRNRFLNYEAQAVRGAKVNPDILRPTNSNLLTWQGWNQSPAYTSMLADSARRVANRYGGSFETQYDDPLLDYSSYALEAAPQLALAAGTMGTSALGQAGTKAPMLVRGFGALEQPIAALVSKSPALARMASNPVLKPLLRTGGSWLSNAGNFAISGINPVPLLAEAASMGNTYKALPALLAAGAARYGAKENWRNAFQDASNYLANNYDPEHPYSSVGPALGQFGESLAATGINFDPSSVNPLGVGASVLTEPFAAVREQGLNTRLAGDFERLQQQNPDIAAQLAQHPAELEARLNALRSRYEQQSTGVGAALANANKVFSVNPARWLGAQTYPERLQQAAVAGDKAMTAAEPAIMAALQRGQNPLEVPGLLDALKNASPEQQQMMSAQLMQMVNNWQSQQPSMTPITANQ